MNLLTLGRSALRPITHRPSGPRAPMDARRWPSARRPQQQMARAAADAPFAPTPPAPRPQSGFFDDVARRCLQLARTGPIEPESALWAQRFVAAIKQYLAAHAAWESVARTPGAPQRFFEARAQALFTLDVASRISARAPQDIVDALGDLAADTAVHVPTSIADAADAMPTLSTWKSVGRTLRLAQAYLLSASYVPPVAEAQESIDGISLAHLRGLLEKVEKKKIDLPAVVLWHQDVRDALEHYDVAEATLEQRGHGWHGLHVLNTLHCVEALKVAVGKLPFSIHTFTDPCATFEASSRWQDAAGAYLRGKRELGSQSDRVHAYLRLRGNELRQEAEPYQHTLS